MFFLFPNDETYYLTQGLFIRLLGLTFLIGFLSLYVQIPALYSSKGISPINNLLNYVEKRFKKKPYYLLPTLFWISSSDWFIKTLGLTGIISSICVVLGIIPSIFLALCWAIYLSFCKAGSEFLSFQWDALLLEVGFLGIFFALSPPTILWILLLWFVLFRFMFSSGYAKLVWGTKEWRELTAMDYHYETQPLPTVFGYYAHFQPRWLGKVSVLLMHLIEVAVPFFIFTPYRFFAFCALVFLQLMIMITGNYTFFNILSMTLCVPLLPDSYWSWMGEWVAIQPLFSNELLFNLIAGVFLFFNVLKFVSLFTDVKIFSFLSHFEILNSYGLFVHLTSERNEIIIEGSDDNQSWKAYEFKWKPGDPMQRPRFVAPHQPRLDWQMWFAALSSLENNPWLETLLSKLLERSPEILALFKYNPFPNKPPKYIRASLYNYRFNKENTPAWWTRTYIGPYSPTFFIH